MRLLLLTSVCFLLLACTPETLLGQGSKRVTPIKIDFLKKIVERPLEGVLAGPAIEKAEAILNQPHRAKSAIETPIEGLLKSGPIAKKEKRNADLLEKIVETIKTTKAENPKVKPGLVNWHADFATACAASKESGKPVLLFQLLGNLDQRFT